MYETKQWFDKASTRLALLNGTEPVCTLIAKSFQNGASDRGF